MHRRHTPMLKKYFSVLCSAVILAGLMVTLLDEGPLEVPYAEGVWSYPIGSPRFDTLDQNVPPPTTRAPIAAEKHFEAPPTAPGLAYGSPESFTAQDTAEEEQPPKTQRPIRIIYTSRAE